MSERQKLQKACLRREPGAGTLALCLALPTIAVPMSAGPKNVAEGTGVACGSRGTSATLSTAPGQGCLGTKAKPLHSGTNC